VYFSDPAWVFDDLGNFILFMTDERFRSSGVKHLMHTSSILRLLLNFNRLNVGRFILIFDLVHLVLKKLVIIALLIVKYTGPQQ